jgi:hypothetical protein
VEEGRGEELEEGEDKEKKKGRERNTMQADKEKGVKGRKDEIGKEGKIGNI